MLRFSISKFRPALYALASSSALYLLLRYTPLPEARLKQGWSFAALDSQGRLLRISLSSDGRYRLPLKLDEISPSVREGFLRYEDRWFHWHPGVNPAAILRALRQNLGSGRRVSGASTITMQLAKMLAPRPRGWGAKLLEAFRALQLEARYSKDEIFTHYLNLVPMGGNIEGVGAASLLYFGRPASTLSLGEAALLISLPRSPNARRPDRDAAAAKKGRDDVLERLFAHWEVSEDRRLSAFKAELPKARQANPNLAPHLVERLKGELRARPGIRQLSLDPGLQAPAEEELRRFSEKLQPWGIFNGAVVIVENATMKVRAYVGSPDFMDEHEGQVNGAASLRSPGSALKPFLYGKAFDLGILAQKTAVYDIPRDFGGYRPANFEGVFQGAVSAEEALIRSLNTPAVWLEAQLIPKGGGLVEMLRSTGFGDGREGLDPGLSSALGAYPVNLEEISSLYAALANQGKLRRLVFFEDGETLPQGQGERLLSEQSTYLVLDSLSRVQRPDLPAAWEYSPIRGRVAFKTGTSFGFRDAWCVGVSPDYTVGVWLGNSDARGAAGLKGSSTAAPLCIALFNRISRHKDRWFSPPQGVAKREVCADSGLPPNADCPRREEEWFIPGKSPYAPCEIHRRLWIRKKDGLRLESGCLEGRATLYASKVFTLWPPELTRYLRGVGARYQGIPRMAPDCLAPSASLPPPRILSPLAAGSYEISALLPLEQQKIALSAQTAADAKRLYWFVDGFLLAEGKPDEVLFWKPHAGRAEITAVDSEGRSSKLEVRVMEKAKKP